MTLFAILIAAGIIVKRVYGHSDWMTFFHLPAAVFLVLAFQKLSRPYRDRRRSLESLRAADLVKDSPPA